MPRARWYRRPRPTPAEPLVRVDTMTFPEALAQRNWWRKDGELVQVRDLDPGYRLGLLHALERDAEAYWQECRRGMTLLEVLRSAQADPLVWMQAQPLYQELDALTRGGRHAG